MQLYHKSYAWYCISSYFVGPVRYERFCIDWCSSFTLIEFLTDTCKGTYLITISYVRDLNLFIKSALQQAANYKKNSGFWHHRASCINLFFLFLIQELCLHTKLLASPNTSIADFLSKAAEPPPFLVLRNAVALLKVKVCSGNQGFVYIKLWWLRVCHMHIHYQ